MSGARTPSDARGIAAATALLLALVSLVSLVAFTTTACATAPDERELARQNPPDKEQFLRGGVNDFMVARCGALDCHGQVGRPLRLYGVNGLRKVPPLEVELERPTGPLTAEELDDNYLSVVGLEPEALGYARAVEGEYLDFLLLKKPISIEGGGVRHKGGPVLRPTGDPGFECILSWISGDVEATECAAATF